MADEFRFHSEHEIAKNISAGMTPADARAAAMKKFGAADVHAEAVRDARGARWLDDLRADGRYAVRGLRRAPGAALIAVLTLSLGIGATVSIFSVVNGVLLEPLPYPEPDRLVSVWGRFLPESGFDFPWFPLSGPEYFDYASQSTSHEGVAAYMNAGATLIGDDGMAVRIRAARVTASLFDVYGVSPSLGRTFSAEEDVPDGNGVVVLSHGLWQSAYGGDPAVLGRTVRINGRQLQVIGVMPEGFDAPGEGRQAWLPLGLDPGNPGGRSSHGLSAIARLRPEVSLEHATSEMTTLMARWKAEYPDVHTGHFLVLLTLTDDMVGDTRPALLLVLSAVGVVLLLVCVNVAHVLLAKSVTRSREMAVRAALGAGRVRLIQQTLAESALLAAAGTLIGLLGARLALAPIIALSGGSIPRTSNITLDLRVAAFAAGVSVLVTLLSGMLPAIRAGRVQPIVAMRESGRGSTGGIASHRARGLLVIGEVALAALIVLAAGLLTRSYRDLTAVSPGFDPEGVLFVDLALPAVDYPDADAIVAFYEGLRGRLSALPGVQSVAATSTLPLFEGPSNTDFEIEDRAAPGPGQPATSGDLMSVTPDLTDALGIPVLDGRFFTPSDGPHATPVVVISRTLARMFFESQDPLGRRLRIIGDSTPWLTIVGVLDDVLFASLDAQPRPAYYLPLAQAALTFGRPSLGYTFAIRTTGDPMSLAPLVSAAVREADSRLPISRMDALEQVVAESVARPRFTLSLFGMFAGLALVLGAIGLYGVLSCAVAERNRELGIRLALGARRLEVARLVMFHGMRLTIIGLVIGFIASLATGRLMSGMLYGVSPTDPVTYLAVAIALVVVTLVACAVPMLRALTLDPAGVLRQ